MIRALVLLLVFSTEVLAQHVEYKSISSKLLGREVRYGVYQDNGDGTVPLVSSEGGNIVYPWNRIYVHKSHTELPWAFSQGSPVHDGILKLLQGVSASAGGLEPGIEVVPQILQRDFPVRS